MTPDPILAAVLIIVATTAFTLGWIDGARAAGATDPLLPLKRGIARVLKRLAARFHR